MITYVDTSVIVKLLIDEAESEHAEVIWTSAESLATCSLAFVETRAALSAAHRANRITVDEMNEAQLGFDELWSQVHVVEVDDDLIRYAADLAHQHGLRGYDAVHLSAAVAVGAHVIAVSDGRLARAGAAQGLVVVVPTELVVAEGVHLDGPAVRLVNDWLEAVADRRDLAAAWPLTDPDFRLALVQSWICAGCAPTDIDAESVAHLLAAPTQPSHPLWNVFAAWRIGRWDSVISDFFADASRRGTVSSPYLCGPDLEAVLISELPGAPWVGDRTVEVQRFSVRHTNGTVLLAGLGAVLPIPGWPPADLPLPPLPDSFDHD